MHVSDTSSTMHLIGKTTLEKLTTALLATIIISVVALILKAFLISVIGGLIFVLLCPWWFRSLSEVLIIALLKRKQGHCTYDELFKEYPKKIIATISRLEKAGIVEVKNNEIILINRDDACVFDKSEKT